MLPHGAGRILPRTIFADGSPWAGVGKGSSIFTRTPNLGSHYSLPRLAKVYRTPVLLGLCAMVCRSRHSRRNPPLALSVAGGQDRSCNNLGCRHFSREGLVYRIDNHDIFQPQYAGTSGRPGPGKREARQHVMQTLTASHLRRASASFMWKSGTRKPAITNSIRLSS